MRIVVLDGYTLNPGDLSWDGLTALGEVTVHDRTPVELIVIRSQSAEIAITNKVPFSTATLSQLTRLRYIGVAATGYNVVDVKAATERGMVVTNVPMYGTNSVAQMVFALLLEFCRNVRLHSEAVRQGEWSRCQDFCFWRSSQIELGGKTMGIIGFGRIGYQVARIASSMGMRVMAADAVQREVSDLQEFCWAPVSDVIHQADVLSLHCPLTPQTEGLINRKTIDAMKRSAFLINTSRGPLVVEADLAEALNNGWIAGAGLDVVSVEPPPAGSPLLSAKNCIITPHIAWATFEARKRLMDIVVENLKAFLADKPINVVSG